MTTIDRPSRPGSTGSRRPVSLTLLVIAAVALLIGVAVACGVPTSSRLDKAPKAWQASAKALGLDFDKKLILTGEVDGVAVEVRRERRDPNSGAGFQTQCRVALGLPQDFGMDTSTDASVVAWLADSQKSMLQLGDPAFDESVRVWGDPNSAQITLHADARQAVLASEKDARLLIINGMLIGEKPGLVKSEKELTAMIRATVSAARAIKP